MKHISVLLKEVIDGLEIKDKDVYVDMTLGGVGHAKAVADSGAKDLTIIGIDADEEAIQRGQEIFEDSPHKIILENKYFDSLSQVLKDHQINNIDKVLFDLGFSSFQIDSPERGFSFKDNGPLKMTYIRDNPNFTAHDVVNEWSEESLSDIIYGFGEEKFANRIARKIVEARQLKEIRTTKELAEIVSKAVPFKFRFGKIHPATKTFQAIRIAVNSELERLRKALNMAFEALNKGGRIAVISFHSHEDRIVKIFFKEKEKEELLKIINKKPIVPSEEEIENNPRSRSAKLRIIEKI